MSAKAFQQGSTPRLTATIRDGDGDVVPLNGATLKKFRVNPPAGGAPYEVTASFTTDGTNGKVYIVLTADQTAVAGEHRFQVFVTLASGFSGATRPGSFTVVANLTAP